MKSRTALLFGTVLLAASLTGCGGGGGGGSDPKDTAKPVVVFSTPADKSVGLGTTSAITVVFSEAIDPATINKPGSFILVKDVTTTSISGSITYVDKTAQFKPTALEPNTSYTASVTTGVTDLAGNPLEAIYSWKFTTGGASDSTPPTVLRTYPASTIVATNVALNSAIAVTFNEEIDPATINAQTITLLSDGTTAVSGTVSYVGTTALFKPTSALGANASYTANVTTGVKDLAGNALAANYSWQFTTGGAPDSSAPLVQTTNPAGGATGVAVDSAITVTFNEPVIPFYYGLVDGSPVAVTFNDTYTTVTLKPAEPMKANVTYALGIMVHDMAGNPMPGAFFWTFTTISP